jgi:hypothetical protein
MKMRMAGMKGMAGLGAATLVVTMGATSLLAAACGGGSGQPKTAATAPGGTHDQSKWPKDDRTLCDWRNKPELEVQETVGPGSIRPNVRRVYKWVGERDNRKKILVCREIDTNLDGIKDVARVFNEKGEAKHEEADTDYDGVIDVKIDFVDGRLAKEELDTKHGSTAAMFKPDVWKFYVDGEITRIRRNTKCANGKADTWEIYRVGADKKMHLERIGNDLSCDGHVDRWDRDTERIAAAAEAERKQESAKADAGSQPTTIGDDGGTVKPPDGGKRSQK